MTPIIKLVELVGKEIQISAPFITDNEFRTVTLHGLEDGGIWISGNDISDMVHRVVKSTMLARTPVLFVPFARINAILQSVEGVQISDKALVE